MEPDAIIVYSGNNEFLEKREYPIMGIAELNRLAARLRTVQWLRSLLGLQRTNLPADDLKDVALFFWKKVQRQALDLRQDPVQFENVQTHYRHTMEYMVRKANKMGIPLFLSTVPVNLRDWLPTVSHNSLTGIELAEWERVYDLGRRYLLENRYQEGLEWMSRAVRLEPEHAESHFWLGRLLEAEGRFEEALESYSLARDQDYNPFRAISHFNESLRVLAERNQSVSLIDLEGAFSQASKNGIPGFDLFLDYVHPNTAGNKLIAETIYRALAARSELSRGWELRGFSQESAAIIYGNTYDDTYDKALQIRLFSLYAMNHQYEAAIENIEHLFRLHGQSANAESVKTLPPKLLEGFTAFQGYESASRSKLLGQAEETEMEDAQRILNAYYEKWFPYGVF
jgi:tetratricopeptide (TPR) repeat protein